VPADSIPASPEFTVASLADGSADRAVRLFAARSLLPLGIEDRLRTLLAIAYDPDPEIAEEAKRSLARVTPDEWGLLFDLATLSGDEIETVALSTDDPAVLEQIVRHHDTPDSVLIRMARQTTGAVQESLVVNQKRLLANPDLITALEENPSLTSDSRRLLREMREEFFEKAERRAALAEHDAEEANRRAAAEALSAETPPPEEPTIVFHDPPEGEPEVEKVRRMALHQRLAYMTVAQRIDTATKGTREERRVLITSVMKPVWEAVLKSPFLSDVELEAFAAMRNVDEEVYRRMVAKPEWVRKYAVVRALIQNPKVPPDVGMSLVKFLRMRDLKAVMIDRNLHEGVRVTARKLYLIKRA